MNEQDEFFAKVGLSRRRPPIPDVWAIVADVRRQCRRQQALDAYWAATNHEEERVAYRRMRELGFPTGLWGGL